MLRLFLLAVALWVGSAILLIVSIVLVAALVGPTVAGGERGVVILLGVGLGVIALSIVTFARVAAPHMQGPAYLGTLLLFTVSHLLLLPPYLLLLLVVLNR